MTGVAEMNEFSRAESSGVRIYDAKEQYLIRLRERLNGISPEEIDDAMFYYDEYLSEAEREGVFEQKLKALGSARQVAANIMRDKAYKETRTPAPVPKRINTALLTAFGAFTSFVAATAGLAFYIFVSIAFTVATIAVVLFLAGLGVLSAGLIISGVAYIALSPSLLFTHLASGFFFYGAGLCLVGLGALVGVAVLRTVRLCLRGGKVLFKKHLPEIFRNTFAKKRRAG